MSRLEKFSLEDGSQQAHPYSITFETDTLMKSSSFAIESPLKSGNMEHCVSCGVEYHIITENPRSFETIVS